MLADECRPRGPLRLALTLWLALTLTLACDALAPALAQAADPVAATRAEELFEQGKRQFDAGDVDRACASLAESDRLDPHVGTLGLLAACREKQGELAAAHRAYVETAERARAASDDRERFARESATALEPRLARVTVQLGAERGPSDVSIAGQGRQVGSGAASTALVDPGEVEIRVSARGRVPWRRVLRADEGMHVHLEVPALAPTARIPPKAPPAEPIARASRGLPPLAYGAGAAAIAGLGVGAGFGIAAVVWANDADPFCDARDRCTPTGGAKRDDARTLARVSTVGFGAAAVGAGVAIAAWLTADDEPEPSRRAAKRVRVAPIIAPQSGGAVLRGAF